MYMYPRLVAWLERAVLVRTEQNKTNEQRYDTDVQTASPLMGTERNGTNEQRYDVDLQTERLQPPTQIKNKRYETAVVWWWTGPRKKRHRILRGSAQHRPTTGPAPPPSRVQIFVRLLENCFSPGVALRAWYTPHPTSIPQS